MAQSPLRAANIDMKPQSRWWKMSEALTSTSASCPCTTTVPSIAAPMMYGAKVKPHVLLELLVWALAGLASAVSARAAPRASAVPRASSVAVGRVLLGADMCHLLEA